MGENSITLKSISNIYRHILQESYGQLLRYQ